MSETILDQLIRLKRERPVRFFIAVWITRTIRAVIYTVFLPFAIVGVVVEWLHWTAFPFVYERLHFVPKALFGFSYWLGDKIVGVQRHS